MSKPASKLPVSPPPRRRLRRFFLLGACVLFVLIATPIAIYLWASSAATQELVRRRMIATLEETTGGRVEIATFRWNLFDLNADAGGVVIHGLEAPNEAPLAQIDHLSASITVLGIFSPHILLRNLEVQHPAFHLLVYPDGTTNVPTPRKRKTPSTPVLDTIFNFQAGRVALQQGELNFENRATEFDFQNRFTLLEFDARDVGVLMRYMPADGGSPESYRIEAGASDLNLSRAKAKPSLGSMQTTLDVSRTAAYLRFLRITSKVPASKGHPEEHHTVEVSGTLQNFANATWNGRTTGELDMRLLDPVFGFP